MSSKPNPTQPHQQPVNPEDLDARLAAGPRPTNGHWYSYTTPQPTGSSSSAGTFNPPTAGADGGGHSARDRVRRRKVRREMGAPDDWAWVIIAAALLGVTLVMSMSIFFLLRAANVNGSVVATSTPPIEPTSVLYGEGGILEIQGDGQVGGMLGDGQSMIIRPWDGEERFTVLVMGMDKRPGETSFLTDTMLLVSLDPRTNQVSMLSLPRDLFVEVPGYGLQRINTAYSFGEYEGSGGGPTLAMRTVQYNFGIPVNDYLLVDFNAFIRIIDEIGGIDVYVPNAIYDPEYPDMNYGYDPFSISAGWQHLDGATALKYARSRHTSDDIDRARRQQDVIDAIREKVVARDMIPTLAAKSYALWSEISSGVKTGLSLEQILELAWYVKDISPENFKRGVVDWQYVTPINWEGKDVLVPSRDKLPQLMTEVFGPDYSQP